MTQMFWELALAALAGWTVLPALVWALASEIMRLIWPHNNWSLSYSGHLHSNPGECYGDFSSIVASDAHLSGQDSWGSGFYFISIVIRASLITAF